MKAKIGLISLAGEYEVGFDKTPALLDGVYENLNKENVDIIKSNIVIYDSSTMKACANELKGKEIDVILVCVGTWSEDHHLLDFLEYIDKPVILWAFPAFDTGSLCGAQQICCVLKELEKVYYYVYGETNDEKVIIKILQVSRAIALKNKLRFVKIGNIGGRIKGMTEIAFDEFEIKKKLGVRIVNIDESELTEAFLTTDENKAETYWNSITEEVGKVTSTKKEGIEAIRYYYAMKKLVNEYELEGLAVKCYPRWMGKICLGYSILSEEEIVCGCEGDVNNTVSMKILFELSNQPTHNTDMLYPDLDLNTILFSHCGSGGFSLAKNKEDINLGPVRLANEGVCSLFSAKPGKVTLINIVGRKDTLRLSVMVGEAIECGMEFPGNPLKVKFDRKVEEINEVIAKEGIGHHWIGGYTDMSKELEYFCELNKIKFIRI